MIRILPKLRSLTLNTYQTRFAHRLTFKAPPTGVESISTYWVIEWIAKLGQQVKKDDLIVILGTDKTNMEMRSEYVGKITQHLRTPMVDDKVTEEFSVGDSVYTIDVEPNIESDLTSNANLH